MKKFQLILILLLSISFNAQQKISSNLSDFNIRGKVKSFKLKTKNYEDPNKISKEGNTIYVQLDPNFVSEFYFNAQGILYESKSQEYFNSWKKYEFSCNEANPLVTKITTYAINKNSKKEHFTVFVTYQDQSRLVITQLQDGKTHSIRSIFDSKGNIIKEHLEPIGDKVFTYTYDEKNNMIEKKKNQEFYLKNIYVYDHDNKIIEKTEIHNNGQISIFTYNNGLLASITNPEGDKQTFTYEFDKNGNWIKRFHKVNGVLVSEDFREFVYNEE